MKVLWFRTLCLFAVLCCLGLSTGCTPLRPYEKAVRSIDPSELLRLPSGQQVHVVQEGEGEPLLLLHGFGGSTFTWRKLVPELAKDYRVVAMDLNGFGYTERPEDLAAYTRASQIRLIEAVLDELQLEQVHLFGHSYGGGLALTFAHRHPDRVRSLVLIDTTAPDYAFQRRKSIGVGPAAWLFVRGLALRPRAVARGLRRSYADDSLVTPEVVQEYRERLQIKGATRAYRGLTSPSLSSHDEPPVVLEEIRKPTLVIWGELDSLIGVESARRAISPMPNVAFEVVPGAGHAPMEEKPEAVLAWVRPFLADVE